jgi:hypothetical protein
MSEDGRSCFSCKYNMLCIVSNTLRSVLPKIRTNINSDDAPGRWIDIFKSIGNCCLEYESNENKNKKS